MEAETGRRGRSRIWGGEEGTAGIGQDETGAGACQLTLEKGGGCERDERRRRR